MIVTKIETIAKQKYQVEIDEHLVFLLFKNELMRYSIKENEPLDEKTYEKLVKKTTKKAKLKAMRLLQQMDRTEKELQMRLLRNGYPEFIADAAIAYVKSYGYINDTEYARRYIDVHKEGKGKLRLMAELCRKGVPNEIAAQALEEMEFEDPKAMIRRLITEKRRHDSFENQKELKRTADFLSRRGFQGSDIWSVLKEESTKGKPI